MDFDILIEQDWIATAPDKVGAGLDLIYIDRCSPSQSELIVHSDCHGFVELGQYNICLGLCRMKLAIEVNMYVQTRGFLHQDVWSDLTMCITGPVCANACMNMNMIMHT